ncbi:SusC/RagA family TonB-linked outer membrane protein [Mucilaginibacter flavus]|uniref:SusC/RagA family TonB-linked outer membrane protein n=1 Tax=Mucilaginibacter flavus TaxID=931504 RepID=UPI0025B36B0D|nr:TonB-dependent receptor [Mucilaginibacter flavus]MDN3584812.1 TonB-dependent receptor [Mucilaginibacter flavus]
MQLKLKFCLSIALLLCLVSGAFAQNIRLTGKVTQKTDGQPLPGASVTLKGTTTGAVTDASGNYTLSLPQGGGTLVVSFLGMKTVEKTVTAAGVVDFVLEDNAANALNEVVVVGYGTQKITKVSGAISTVKSADIQKLTPTRAEEALQGQVSGVSVIQSGSPGSKPTVLIRGIPSFTGTDPTVIIDGVQQTLTDFNSINPSDIESINVLKDAATTAIYGVKGGNGVIVVTTKTGRKNQKPQISLNANYGVQEVARYIGVLNASEYGAIVNEGSVSSGGAVIFPDLSTLGVGTDWQRQIFHTAPMQTYNASATGGSDAVSYFLSAGYQSQGGIVGGLDKSRFDRGNFTANLNFQLSKKLKFTVNATDVILNSKGVQENSFNSILGSALNFDPTVPVYNNVPNTVGKYGFSNLILSEVYNPLTKLDNTYNKNVGNKLYGKFELQYNPLNNLTLTSRFGYTKYDSNAKTFTPLIFYGPQNVDNTMNADGSTVTGMHNSVSHEKDSNFNYSWETYGNYNFDLAKDHHFETTLGFSMYRTSGNADGASRQDVPFNSWEFADFTAATGTNTATNTNALSGFYYQYFRRNISYFGRVNYDYKEKYLASFTARRDGSYAFGVDNKFGNFYSGSLGWVVTKEDFFNVQAISFLKIRGSYGVIGNENVNPQYVKIVTGGPDYGPTANSNGYNFDNVFYPGSTVGSAANDALKWERQIQSNVGFDIKFLNNNLSLTADYYQKKVSGLLFTPNASLYLGTVPIPTANIGSTKTNGIDITVGYNTAVSRDLKIGNTVTFTTAKNVVTATNTDNSAKIYGGSYFNGQSQTVTVFQKGFTPGYFYGYKTDGLFQSAQEIAASPTQPGAQPGDIKYVDVNKDGKIDANDQTKIGDPFPKFTMGWNLSISYKSFDFSAFTYASIGNDIYRAYERNGNYTNKFRSVLARWTGPGTTNDARYPRYSFTDPNSNIRVSDRYVENGSFVKVKNLQLGFTFPKSITGKVFSSVRVYGQVKNAFVITKYTGYDPEISGGILDTGVDRGEYPQPRIYSFGLDIKL